MTPTAELLEGLISKGIIKVNHLERDGELEKIVADDDGFFRRGQHLIMVRNHVATWVKGFNVKGNAVATETLMNITIPGLRNGEYLANYCARITGEFSKNVIDSNGLNSVLIHMKGTGRNI